MQAWQTVVMLTLMAGMAMPLGGWLSSVGRLGPAWLDNELRHGIVAFGGGALLSAVALVLVPEGSAELSAGVAVAWLLAGGLAFMGLDVWLQRSDTQASQLAAMLADFVPEALALGAAFALGGEGGVLLAVLMALQNLPEGFNAIQELKRGTDYSTRRLLLIFVAMAWLGPVAGLGGLFWLSHYPQAVSAIMLFASGGILYSVFQDLAPQARLEQHWAPPLGAVLGFALGLAGHLLMP
jgi:ZIP family zinc transporter